MYDLMKDIYDICYTQMENTIKPRGGSLDGEEPRVGSVDGEEPRVRSVGGEEPRVYSVDGEASQGRVGHLMMMIIIIIMSKICTT
jgi:hypothetical protein